MCSEVNLERNERKNERTRRRSCVFLNSSDFRDTSSDLKLQGIKTKLL